MERTTKDATAKAKKPDANDSGAKPGKRSLTELTAGSSGQPLPDGTRKKFEARFGTGLGAVRVHIDAKAAEAAQSLGAKAFTVGQCIYFGAGQYNPDTPAGGQLLAHELTHTVQQGNVATDGPLDVNKPGDTHEQEAEAVAKSVDEVDAGADKVEEGAGAEASADAGAQAVAETKAKVTPSAGSIQRAVIQRDLLDGGPPPELQTPPVPLDVKPLSNAEIAAKAQETIRKARGNGGTQGVIQAVHTLRGNASGEHRGAVETAITSELTEEEKKALDGGGSDATATANASSGNSKHEEAPAGPAPMPTKPAGPSAKSGSAAVDKSSGDHEATAKGGTKDEATSEDATAKPGQTGKEAKADKEAKDAEGGGKEDGQGREGDREEGRRRGQGRRRREVGRRGGRQGQGRWRGRQGRQG